MSLRFLWLALLLFAIPVNASAAVYDLDALGVPKFVNVIYIDLPKVTQLSKFRSSAGHDYHDDQEACRSMKHYFMAPDASAKIRSPVAGTVSKLDDDFAGKQVQITADAQPAFTFIIFHVALARPLSVGEHIDEGQVLGNHVGLATYSDIAVGVNAPNASYRLVSYFETLTDAAFAPFQARGVASRSQLIIPKAERDADPYRCDGQAFINLRTPADLEYVTLTGGAAHQTIASVANLSSFTRLADSPVTLSATASSGLPVTFASSTPAVCTTESNKLILLAGGQCTLVYGQEGNDAYFASSQYQLSTTVVAGILQTGPVFASAQPGSSSFLRFFNTGTAAGTITATLRDSTSARQLGQWTSPSIPAGAELQYPIGVLESAAGLAPGAGFYALSLQSDISGSFQHVLYRPANGALTNLSTCYEGVAADPARLAGVHSSLLADYPSAIVLNSAYPAPQTVNLGVYDARNGVLIGTYASGTIPGYGQLVLPVKTIETAIGKAPAPGLLHYVVKIDAAFSDNGVPRSAFIGNLQHLVSNTLAGVVTDMTTTCTLDGAGLAGAPTSPLRAGPIFSSAQTASQSYLRFLNGGITEGFVIATLTDSATGQSLGRWVSPGIRPGAESQFAIATIESAIGTAAKPANYGLALETTITSGAFQHVLFRPADGTLTNLSTCYASVTADPARAAAVHTSLVGALGYPSAIAVTNTGAVDEAVRLGLYDARFGNRVGAMTTAPIPAHGQLIVDVAAMEAAAAVTPTAGMSHYVVKAEGAFTGFLQHLVTNSRAGVVTDMSAQCVLPSPASPDLTYTLSTATAGNGAGTVTLTPYGTTGPGPYRFGTIVGVSATPAAGSVFAGFSGDCPLPGYSFDSCQLTMKGNYAVTAVFNLAATPDTYLLTVTPSSAAGGLGTVTSSSGGIDCSAVGIAAGAVTAQAVTAQAVTGACNARLAPGTRVTLTASPAQGSRFERWSTACENGPATAPTCVVTMNTNRYLPVSFGVAP